MPSRFTWAQPSAAKLVASSFSSSGLGTASAGSECASGARGDAADAADTAGAGPSTASQGCKKAWTCSASGRSVAGHASGSQASVSAAKSCCLTFRGQPTSWSCASQASSSTPKRNSSVAGCPLARATLVPAQASGRSPSGGACVRAAASGTASAAPASNSGALCNTCRMMASSMGRKGQRLPARWKSARASAYSAWFISTSPNSTMMA
mmetsp:Transcript_86208/g.279040  ORF Transcript_86208/g.279040 Transcript_86208/m.279040 type:complete len:209 (-) Transcript_86208:668-1294(-)